MSNKKFTVHLDNQKFNAKPNSVATLSNRISKLKVDIDAPSLARSLTEGQTLVACELQKDKNGILRRSITNWKSQEIICLDFDKGMSLQDAIVEFKDIAMFIYTTFSHTQENNKFRVVIALDTKIDIYEDIKDVYEYMIEKYPKCDKSCVDGSRLFYGGKELFTLNYDNRLNVKSILDAPSLCGHVRETKDNYPYVTTPTSPSYIQSKNKHKEAIRMQDVEYLRKHLGINKDMKKLFFTHDETYSYLKRQDLNLFLGVPHGRFSCIFHKDSSPSANVIINQDTGDQIYKCFSENCSCKVGTIFKCVQQLTGLDRIECAKFLKDVYNIEQKETDFQKQQKEIIEENIRYISSDDFEIEYPVQFKLIKSYRENLITFLNLAKDHITPEHYTEDQALPIFYTSMRKFANLCGLENVKRIGDRVALFAFLYYICKLSHEEMPEQLKKKLSGELVFAKKELASRPVYNSKSCFEINSFDKDTMDRAEMKAIEYFDNKFTARGWGYELLYRSLGKEEADRVYPQLTRIAIPEKSDEHSMIMEKIIMDEIKTSGWVAEKDLIQKADLEWGGKNYKERQWKIIIQEVIDKYDLKRCRLNKAMKKKLNVDKIQGSPSILYK